RGKFCWFDHKRVAGGNCWGDLPGRLQQWEVPRGDHADHTDGFMYDTRDDCRIAGIDQATGVVVRDLAEMAEGRDDIVHIAFCFDQAFAGVESFCASELVLALPNTFGNGQ